MSNVNFIAVPLTIQAKSLWKHTVRLKYTICCLWKSETNSTLSKFEEKNINPHHVWSGPGPRSAVRSCAKSSLLIFAAHRLILLQLQVTPYKSHVILHSGSALVGRGLCQELIVFSAAFGGVKCRSRTNDKPPFHFHVHAVGAASLRPSLLRSSSVAWIPRRGSRCEFNDPDWGLTRDTINRIRLCYNVGIIAVSAVCTIRCRNYS